jgi:two-component system, OmpR family, sensor kinase
MSRAERSLSAHMTWRLLVAIGGVWMLMTAGSAWQARFAMNESMDRTLVDTSHRLLNLAMHDMEPAGNPDANRHWPELVPRDASAYEDDHIVYQVVSASGKVLLRSKGAPEQPLPVQRVAGFADVPDWRVYTHKHAERPIFIHVAERLSYRHEAALDMVLWLLLPPLGALPLLGLLIGSVTRRGLAPLQHLARQIRQRDGQDLSPIATSALPRELQVITSSTNHLLQRLNDALNTERALAVNAANELRTPLSAALQRLHALLGMNLAPEVRVEAGKGLASLLQLNHRAEKLLQLARAESGAALSIEWVNLEELAGVVMHDFWSLDGLRERLHLYAPAEEDVIALGDFDSLEIVLRNLIENAVRHCTEGDIDIVVEAQAVIRVRDSGPGVPPDALESIRVRQLKHTGESAGEGLGLSIVGAIVDKHGGWLVLSSPPQGRQSGFEALVQLRAACVGPDPIPASPAARRCTSGSTST